MANSKEGTDRTPQEICEDIFSKFEEFKQESVQSYSRNQAAPARRARRLVSEIYKLGKEYRVATIETFIHNKKAK